jgi:hypothetical protein
LQHELVTGREDFGEWQLRNEVEVDWQREQRCCNPNCRGNSRVQKGHGKSENEEKQSNRGHREQRPRKPPPTEFCACKVERIARRDKDTKEAADRLQHLRQVRLFHLTFTIWHGAIQLISDTSHHIVWDCCSFEGAVQDYYRQHAFELTISQ